MRNAAQTSLVAMMITATILAAPSHALTIAPASATDMTPIEAALTADASVLNGSDGDALKALEWIGSPVETSDGDLLGTLRGVVRSYEDGESDRLTIERGDDTVFEVPLPGIGYRDGRVIVPSNSLGAKRGATSAPSAAR